MKPRKEAINKKGKNQSIKDFKMNTLHKVRKKLQLSIA
jgi:hypothetical protein